MKPSIFRAKSQYLIPQGKSLVLWLDAANPLNNNTQYSDESAMSTWRDKSSYGNNVNQSTPADQPIFNTNVLNKLPGVRFDGNQYFVSSASPPWINSEVTLFLVAFAFDPAVFVLTGNDNFEIDAQSEQFQLQTSNVVVGSYEISSAFKILTLGRQTGNSKAYENGVQSGSTVTTSLSTPNGSSFYVGTRGDLAVPFDGYISELIMYNRLLTNNERSVVENYLSKKWGIAI